jgi:hypothetical protein
VRADDYDTVVTGPAIPGPHAATLGPAREWAFANTYPNRAIRWPGRDLLPEPMRDLGDALAAWHGGTCAGGIMHHTMHLPWHRDVYPPKESTSVLTVFRDGCDDGYVVVGRTAHTLPEGHALAFDPYDWHGVTVYEAAPGASRIAFTAYVVTP